MSDEIHLGTAYSKNPTTEVRVTASYFDRTDKWYVHIREHILDGDTGEWFRSARGYAIHAEELDTVISLLQEASKQVTEKYYEQYNKLTESKE